MAHDFEQSLDQESPRAWAAFVAYRKLGPSRSVSAAYVASTGKPGRAPGYWADWCAKFHWVERATAYDVWVETERSRAQMGRQRQLDDKIFEYRFQDFARKVRRVNRAEESLDKLDTLPGTDVVRTEGKLLVRVTGLRPTAYANLMRQADRTSAEVILGPGTTNGACKAQAVDRSKDSGTPPSRDTVWTVPSK